MEILYSPMEMEKIKEKMDEDCYVEGIVAIDLSEIIDNDFEGFLDIISEKLVGSELLMDVNYSVVGHKGDELHIKVSGDVSGILEDEEDYEEEE